ncbi:hypothetical protein [Burkholderia stabilis]|uniref:hypothetical protein n=1 Tax=Burkholderia stabilis TaxID=95485 RepID=UPI00158DA746|nr:hypothetical protein [Burkholderia stabilis]
MLYQPLEIVDTDAATAIGMIHEVRQRLAYARRNDDTTPDDAYTDLIEALDYLLALTSDEFAVIEWHARVFPIDAQFERVLRAEYGVEFDALMNELRDLVAKARYITRGYE